MSQSGQRSGGRWLVRRRDLANPAGRVYCIPHSGGSTGEYLRWGDQLPQLEFTGVILPGRGPRRREPSASSLTELATGLVSEARFRSPYFLFGHSFGALLAYHVAQRLRDCGMALPDLLVLSGALPPHLPHDMPALSTLPDEVFLRRLDEKYGGVPTELHQNPELAALVTPTYRADLAILERYTDPGLPPLGCRILVISGDRDEFRIDQLEQWARHTTGACHAQLLPGGHFYFREQPEPLLALLRHLTDERSAVNSPAANHPPATTRTKDTFMHLRCSSTLPGLHQPR